MTNLTKRNLHPIVERLRDERIRQGFTQERLGIDLGYSQNTVCRTERGENNPSLPYICDLATALGFELILCPASSKPTP